MRFWTLLLILSVAGCNTPSRHFRDVEVTRIAVDGSTFDIRHKGRLAEAIRINPEYAPRLGPIARRAEIAMEITTGCPVKEIRGDQAVIIGILNCGGKPGIARVARIETIEIECEVVDVWTPAGGDTTWRTSEC
ncbi:hypothetical protein [Shimia biformata]|uniref:hypothetical protein n=1 Tax=Shimia biformata TaxID=1294299 RepID=UPI00194E4A5B|nr:hypothetical protein [Shimia biformata]